MILQKIVVSYLDSTSNHNSNIIIFKLIGVVSYLDSTSNHNLKDLFNNPSGVVSYLDSTSNHNNGSNYIFIV